ncbi:Gfo/Idh/MocA family protein [Bacillus sp. MRMR6]|uniref:Gfo/Idh/MocA family protein n=1 Tax=Bacillus sp. MRMR6 TaxID=1928617 RepID=UPI000951C8E3|nr:Gfo/Idh/MocA family oxidoreductase [Bacillus sp. MRMR6]OLS33576.1 oxidoreductase [Bacillus sp. MRMR6]
MQKEKIRVGIIGLGSIAHIAHLPILSTIENVEISAVMSQTYSKAQSVATKFGAKQAVQSLDEMVAAGIDCAFVLSPKQVHAESVIPLLKAGVDVFCEKPLAMTLRESEEMVNVAEQTKKILMVGFNRRFAPVYSKAKAAYGDRVPHAVFAEKNRPQTEYRATLENAIHMIDLMRWYCGECDEVEAYSNFEDPYYESLATAQLRFKSGAIGLLLASRSAGQWVERMELYGHNQSVFVESPDSVRVVDNEKETTVTMTPLAMGWARVEDKLGFKQSVEHFLDCVVERKQPLTNGVDALKTHELMNLILKKAGLPDLS